MARFVSPLVGGVPRLSFRIGVVDEDDLIEGDKGVLKGDFALDFTDFEVKFFGEFGGLFRVGDFLFEFVELREFGVEFRRVVEFGNTIGEPVIRILGRFSFDAISPRFILCSSSSLSALRYSVQSEMWV